MQKAVLQTCFSKSWGGLEMVAYEMALRMQSDGYRVTTACVLDSPLERKLRQAKLSTLLIERKNKYVSLGTIQTLRRALQTGGYSAVLVEQLNELWQVVPALRKFPEIRLVGISHTLVGVAKKDWLHRKLYDRVNHLVALTNIHRTNLLENLPVQESALAVIPNAVDLRRFNPQRRQQSIRNEYLKNDNEILIGVVSRIDKGKGLMEVVQAAAQLRLAKVPFRLIIAGRETIGEEGMKQVLNQEIKQQNLAEQVQLIGHRPDIEAVVASLDIMVMPSPGETFGRVLIEAMASNTPIIASQGGGVPDIIQDGTNGLLIPPFDPKALTQALIRLATNKPLRDHLTKNAQYAAQNLYDQKKVDHQLYKLMNLV